MVRGQGLGRPLDCSSLPKYTVYPFIHLLCLTNQGKDSVSWHRQESGPISAQSGDCMGTLTQLKTKTKPSTTQCLQSQANIPLSIYHMPRTEEWEWTKQILPPKRNLHICWGRPMWWGCRRSNRWVLWDHKNGHIIHCVPGKEAMPCTLGWGVEKAI